MKIKRLMKLLRTTAFLIIYMVVVGCSRDNEISTKSIGQIVSATPAIVNYQEGAWMNVATESAVVCISPKEPVYLGKNAYIREFSSGKQYISWEGSKYMYAIGR